MSWHRVVKSNSTASVVATAASKVTREYRSCSSCWSWYRLEIVRFKRLQLSQPDGEVSGGKVCKSGSGGGSWGVRVSKSSYERGEMTVVAALVSAGIRR